MKLKYPASKETPIEITIHLQTKTLLTPLYKEAKWIQICECLRENYSVLPT
jgi:hypothetical protein